MKTKILMLTVFFSGAAFAGSGPAYIDCVSTTGRTKVNIVTQDLYGLESIKLTIDDQAIAYVNQVDGVQSSTVQGSGLYKLKDSVVTVTAENSTNYNFIHFWGLPASFKKIEQSPGLLKYEFQAKIHGTDPRPNPENSSQENDIVVNCKLKYEI
jgi:hypothetical protein